MEIGASNQRHLAELTEREVLFEKEIATAESEKESERLTKEKNNLGSRIGDVYHSALNQDNFSAVFEVTQQIAHEISLVL